MRKIYAVLAAIVLAMFPVVTPASANASASAASGTFYAGNIWSDHNRGGDSKGIFFDNEGWCDSSGYTVNLYGLGGGWNNKISSIAMSGNNGCNAMKVYARSGRVYTYLLVGATYNAPAFPGWNDSAAVPLSIRFYHFG